jgi:hypothetical protein
MINPIWGDDVVFAMKVGGEYIPILCGTSFTYTCDVESIEFTGPNSGGVRQRRRRLEEHTSTVSGLTYVENDDTLSFFYVLQLGVRRESQTFRATFIDGNGDQRTLTGEGIIGPMGISSQMAEFASGDITVWWNEEPEFDAIDDPADECEVVEKLFLTLSEGATSVSSATLSGKTILGVEREGLGQVIIGGTPAAGTRECVFSGTTISFDATNPGNVGGENIYVLYK